MKTNDLKRILVLVVAVLSLTVSHAADIYYHGAGDIDKDGTLGMSDVTCLIDLLLTDNAQPCHDVNGDGHVRIADVTGLIRYLLNGGAWPWPATSVTAPEGAVTYFVNGYPIVMVPVEGGSFMMGSEVSGEKASPVHEVIVSDYSIGLTEVTNGLWKAVMGVYPSGQDYLFYLSNDDMAADPGTWEKCRDFIRRLNELTGLNFHFPTEAQWEYAARGGRYSHGYIYSGSDDLSEVRWTDQTGGYVYLTPVGQKLPNELGIYDMSGNVNEFCEDNYGGYASLGDMNAPLIDPLRLDEYPDYYFRMVRGGYCAGLASDCTVTTRAQYHNTISQVVACGGLRLALGGGPFFVD